MRLIPVIAMLMRGMSVLCPVANACGLKKFAPDWLLAWALLCRSMS